MTDKTDVEKLVETMEPIVQDYDIAMAKAAHASAERITRSQMAAAGKLPGKPKADRQNSQWIRAVIDGRERRLQIVPEDIIIFEATNGSAFAALRSLTGGEWTIALVRRVIELAAMPAFDRELIAKLARWTGAIGVTSIAIPTPAWLEDVLSAKPSAPLASLAALLLTAALFGITDEEAIWSDEIDGAV